MFKIILIIAECQIITLLSKNLYPLFLKSLKKAGLLEKRKEVQKLEKKEVKKLEKILDRDEENLKNLIKAAVENQLRVINFGIAKTKRNYSDT